MADTSHDDRYFKLLAGALRVCAKYKPMFGQGRKGGMTLAQFQTLYRADPFYNWMGLDSPLMYAAHKAAGGMTSIYRQIGIGCQWIFAAVLQDHLGLTEQQATWSYEVPNTKGGTHTLSLDGRIRVDDVRNKDARKRVERWVDEACDKVGLDAEDRADLHGVVFEVRQGYKSKDSKRQNADISNASNAYAKRYLPALFLVSTQIDGDVALRYTTARWLLLTGTTTGATTESGYAFCRDVVGYDLASFFERKSPDIKAELDKVLTALLEP